MANQYRIGFLGLGNMGSAILNGILTQKIFSENEIAFYAPSKQQKKSILLLVSILPRMKFLFVRIARLLF